MSTSNELQQQEGDPVLEGITGAMISLHERYHGRKPVRIKSQRMGADLIACVMGGVYTEVEQTLIELQRGGVVRDSRSAFQEAMKQKFIDEVERITGRHVLAFVSDNHIGPDLEVELFVLAPEGMEDSDDPA